MGLKLFLVKLEQLTPELPFRVHFLTVSNGGVARIVHGVEKCIRGMGRWRVKSIGRNIPLEISSFALLLCTHLVSECNLWRNSVKNIFGMRKIKNRRISINTSSILKLKIKVQMWNKASNCSKSCNRKLFLLKFSENNKSPFQTCRNQFCINFSASAPSTGKVDSS